MYNRQIIAGFWLFLCVTLFSDTTVAQKLTKTFENNSFEEYELVNDSLLIAPAFELLADYGDGSPVQIIEQSVRSVNELPNEISELQIAYNLASDRPLIESLNTGSVKGKRVLSLRIHVSRFDSLNN